MKNVIDLCRTETYINSQIVGMARLVIMNWQICSKIIIMIQKAI